MLKLVEKVVFGPFCTMMGFATCVEPDWRLDVLEVVRTLVDLAF